MSAAHVVHLVVPAGIDDPLQPSGGNTYDRRLAQALAERGWSVHLRTVAGAWPWAGEAGAQALGNALGAISDGSVVLVDGLVASAFPDVVVPATRRLRLVVLMHVPLPLHADDGSARARECGVVIAAAALITTSAWTRRWVLAAYGVDPARVHVANPGVDPASPAAGSDDGGSLLCVGAVTAGKGHDVLLAALRRVADRPWRCVCVGALTVAPDFVADLRRDIQDAGLDGRIELAGPRTGRDLADSYAAADVLVHASRGETYGMVVTEALARALPVLAAHVGGVPEALGVTDDGRMPGLLTPPGDVAGLAGCLRLWLCDPGLRDELRAAARRRRAGLTGWSETAESVANVLAAVTT